MIVKKHISHEGKVIVAICDSDLLGKKFEENDLQLDLRANFYKGEEVSGKELLSIVKDAHILNIVGEKSIEFALKNNLIKKEKILRIKDVPYAQVLIVMGE